MSKPSIIYVSQTQDRRVFVNKVMEIFRREIGDRSVLLKPNVVSHEPYPTTTHTDVVDELLKILQGNKVSVADGTAVDILRTGKITREHPLNDVCKAQGNELLNLHDLKMETRKSPRGMSLKMSAVPGEHGYVISLPVLKSHIQCRMTGALKNQFGLLAKKERTWLHIGRKDIHQGIAELNVFAKPDLFIVDAVITETNANEMRHGGKPTPLGYMLAGTDPVALDAYGLTLLQKLEPKLKEAQPLDIKYIKLAEDFGVGKSEYELRNLEI